MRNRPTIARMTKAVALAFLALVISYLKGETKDRAFRDAINKVRGFKDKNGDEPFASPYYWAAFIMLD